MRCDSIYIGKILKLGVYKGGCDQVRVGFLS